MPDSDFDIPDYTFERPRRPAYRADRDDKHQSWQIAGGLALLALLQLVPVYLHWSDEPRPAWVSVAALFALTQLTYAAWLATVPDWSTVWVAMCVATAVAATYALLLSFVAVTPPSVPLVLDLEGVRQSARLWCCVVVALSALVAYLAGQVSFLWRRRHQGRPTL